VNIVDLFSYLDETNWKKRFDSSLVNGKYPISSAVIFSVTLAAWAYWDEQFSSFPFSK